MHPSLEQVRWIMEVIDRVLKEDESCLVLLEKLRTNLKET